MLAPLCAPCTTLTKPEAVPTTATESDTAVPDKLVQEDEVMRALSQTANVFSIVCYVATHMHVHMFAPIYGVY